MHRVSLSLVAFVLVAVLGGVEAARAVEAADAGLISAIRDGDGAGVRTAIERGADVMAADPDGTTPLHWAAHADDAEIVGQLLAAGADPEAANRYGVRRSRSPAPTAARRLSSCSSTPAPIPIRRSPKGRRC